MKLKLAFIFCLAVPAMPAAHAEPWLCTNAYGVREFSYDPQAPGMTNCIDHPIRPGNKVGTKSRKDALQNDARAPFPRVDARTQKERDTARRAILERELSEERRALALAMQ